MELSALAGNERLKEQLSRQEQGRGLSHAYMISGPAGSGRHVLARQLTAAMLCASPGGDRPCGKCGACTKVRRGLHPDVSVISGPGEGKPITVEQIRTLRADAYVRPNEGNRKVYLLEDADQMNASAQNAMLKLLEEGPPYAVFLLLARNSGGLLQTVRSRCEELALSPLSPRECQVWLSARFPDRPEEEVRRAALDCQGILGRAVEQLEHGEAGQERLALAGRLAGALERADELTLFETAMELDGKQGRDELLMLLDALEAELGSRAARGGDRRRLLRAAELVKTLRGALRLNVNAGQLSGWLCAGMFLQD